MASFENYGILKDFGMRFHHKVEMMCFRNEKERVLTCPVLLLPARLSSPPPPWTASDEGAEGRIELFRFGRKSLAPHLGARRGGTVKRSELGRRINGVSPLLLSGSILEDLNFIIHDVFVKVVTP